jgi:hypothetical protein
MPSRPVTGRQRTSTGEGLRLRARSRWQTRSAFSAPAIGLGVAATLVLLFLASCARDTPSQERSHAPEPSPSGSVRLEPDVRFDVTGQVRQRVEVALNDLRRFGMLDRLTRDLDRLSFSAKRHGVPRGQHLAESKLTVKKSLVSTERTCRATVFPRSISRQYRLQESPRYRVPHPAPSFRRLWAAIVGHELVHCLPGHPGERRARASERRILNR